MKNHLLSLFASLLFLQMHAQNDSAAKHLLALEIDPAPFILNGYSFSVKYGNPDLPHLTFMGSVYGSGFPDKMMTTVNREKGWTDQKFETSFAAFTDYFIRKNKTGFHFGPSLFLYRKSIGMTGSSERIRFSSLYPNLRIGYVCQPFKKLDLYLNPWINFGKEWISSGKTNLGETSFTIPRFQYIIALHLGYYIRFGKE